jgi:hypothetical protein
MGTVRWVVSSVGVKSPYIIEEGTLFVEIKQSSSFYKLNWSFGLKLSRLIMWELPLHFLNRHSKAFGLYFTKQLSISTEQWANHSDIILDHLLCKMLGINYWKINLMLNYKLLIIVNMFYNNKEWQSPWSITLINL